MQTAYATTISKDCTCLERLDEGVEEDAHAPTPPEKLHEPGGPEELEEADRDHLGGVDDAADHRDEVEYVPPVVEIILKGRKLSSPGCIDPSRCETA